MGPAVRVMALLSLHRGEHYDSKPRRQPQDGLASPCGEPEPVDGGGGSRDPAGSGGGTASHHESRRVDSKPFRASRRCEPEAAEEGTAPSTTSVLEVIILDTNVLSEMMKPSPSQAVVAWMARQDASNLYVTTITEAELFHGIELLLRGKRRQMLAAAVEETLTRDFEDRVLVFDRGAARAFSRIASVRKTLGRPIHVQDAMIAAICASLEATLATRDSGGFAHCGIRLADPWKG